MPITFTSVTPRRLVQVQIRPNSGENFVNLAGVEGIAWRPETTVMTDYTNVYTTVGMNLYKPDGTPRGWGRTLRGILWTRDTEAVEALVAASHMNSDLNCTIDINASVQLRWKFNTGLNTNNFRFLTKTVQPVLFGDEWPNDDLAWCRTSLFPDKGKRELIAVPWRLMLPLNNTSFLAPNINAAGLYSNFTNT